MHVIFYGRVQGVGFRWLVCEEAEKHHIKGTVKNLPNGSVELYAEGTKEKLEKMVDVLKQHPGVKKVKRNYLSDKGLYSDFHIVF